MEKEIIENNVLSDGELSDITGGFSKMFRPEAENNEIEVKKVMRSFDNALENKDKMTAFLNLTELKQMNCREYEACRQKFDRAFQENPSNQNINDVRRLKV